LFSGYIDISGKFILIKRMLDMKNPENLFWETIYSGKLGITISSMD